MASKNVSLSIPSDLMKQLRETGSKITPVIGDEQKKETPLYACGCYMSCAGGCQGGCTSPYVYKAPNPARKSEMTLVL